jgi:tRNA pseudouridine38-40 synthase
MLPLNYQLLVAYDGTDFFGWQKNQEGPSIEAALEHAIYIIHREKVTLQAASRTDRGVHAAGQIVNFLTFTPLSNDYKFLKGVNALLPKGIAVLSIRQTNPNFHPTLDVMNKIYHYDLSLGPVQLPHQRRFAWHVHTPLNLSLIEQAATKLQGTHDFSAFTNHKKNEPYEDHIRTVESIELIPLEEGKLRIAVTGVHFLYKMVRNIVGTLVYVGCGKLKIEEIPEILNKKDRTLAGVTAPAHGLTLFAVNYLK